MCIPLCACVFSRPAASEAGRPTTEDPVVGPAPVTDSQGVQTDDVDGCCSAEGPLTLTDAITRIVNQRQVEFVNRLLLPVLDPIDRWCIHPHRLSPTPALEELRRDPQRFPVVLRKLLRTLSLPTHAAGVINRRVDIERHAVALYPTVYLFLRAAQDLDYTPPRDDQNFLQRALFNGLYRRLVDPCARCAVTQRVPVGVPASPSGCRRSRTWCIRSGTRTIPQNLPGSSAVAPSPSATCRPMADRCGTVDRPRRRRTPATTRPQRTRTTG